MNKTKAELEKLLAEFPDGESGNAVCFPYVGPLADLLISYQVKIRELSARLSELEKGPASQQSEVSSEARLSVEEISRLADSFGRGR